MATLDKHLFDCVNRLLPINPVTFLLKLKQLMEAPSLIRLISPH